MPAEMPFLTSDISPIECEVRTRIEDFEVEEIPAYEPCGAGTHTYLWIEKRGISTLDAVRRLSRLLSRNENDIGYAGMKDARGVTRQYLSIEHCPEEKLAGIEIPGVRVLSVGRHRNKLKLGHLKGNRFRALLRGAAPEAVERCRRLLDALARRGVPNLFGPQRFGRRGDTGKTGLALLRQDPGEAASMLFGRPSEDDPPEERASREAFDRGDLDAALRLRPPDGSGLVAVLEAAARGTSWEKAMRRLPKRLCMLYLNAAQSEMFNRVLAARIGSLDSLLPGDIAFLHGRGAVFMVEDPALEAGRLSALEISPTGPMFGAKMLEPKGTPAEIERSVLAEYGLAQANFAGRWARRLHGERRPLRVPLFEPEARIVPEGIEVRFALPPGSYATSVLRELAKRDV